MCMFDVKIECTIKHTKIQIADSSQVTYSLQLEKNYIFIFTLHKTLFQRHVES